MRRRIRYFREAESYASYATKKLAARAIHSLLPPQGLMSGFNALLNSLLGNPEFRGRTVRKSRVKRDSKILSTINSSQMRSINELEFNLCAD